MKFFSYDHPDEDIREAPAIAEARPVLREFSENDLDALYNFLAELRFEPGLNILAAGKKNDALHIIISGTVSVLDAQGKTVEQLGEGEVFGIASFLDGQLQPLAATAATRVGIMVLRRAAFDQLAAWKPPLAMAILQDLGAYQSRRLRQLNLAF